MTYLKTICKATLVSVIAAILLFSVNASADNNDTYIEARYQKYVNEIAAEYSICPELVMAIIESESSGNPDAVNGECIGLMQVSKPCHIDRMKKLGVTDLYNPYGNILVGCDYLAELFEEYEDMSTVLMIYNGTKNAVERGESVNYTEYATKIIDRSYELERLHNK